MYLSIIKGTIANSVKHHTSTISLIRPLMYLYNYRLLEKKRKETKIQYQYGSTIHTDVKKGGKNRPIHHRVTRTAPAHASTYFNTFVRKPLTAPGLSGPGPAANARHEVRLQFALRHAIPKPNPPQERILRYAQSHPMEIISMGPE